MVKHKVSMLGLHPTYRPERMDLLGNLCIAWKMATSRKKNMYVKEGYKGFQITTERPRGDHHEISPEGHAFYCPEATHETMAHTMSLAAAGRGHSSGNPLPVVGSGVSGNRGNGSSG